MEEVRFTETFYARTLKMITWKRTCHRNKTKVCNHEEHYIVNMVSRIMPIPTFGKFGGSMYHAGGLVGDAFISVLHHRQLKPQKSNGPKMVLDSSSPDSAIIKTIQTTLLICLSPNVKFVTS